MLKENQKLERGLWEENLVGEGEKEKNK